MKEANELPLEACLECKRYSLCDSPITRSVFKSKNPDLLVIGGSPSAYEDRTDNPFTSRSAMILKKYEEHVGLSDYKIMRTYAIKCSGEESPSPREMKLCRSLVIGEIHESEPTLVLLLGAAALFTVLGLANITKRRGQLVTVDDVTYLPTFDPAVIARDPRKLKDFIEDLEQARQYLDQRTGKSDKASILKKRYTMPTTIREFDEVMDELERHKIVAYDTEYAPSVDYYDPRLFCLGVSFSYREKQGVFIPIDHPQSPFIGDNYVKNRIKNFLESTELIVHNAPPDITVAIRCFNVNPRKIRVVFDSMTGSMAVHGPDVSHGLKNLSFTLADTGGYESELETYKEKYAIQSYADIDLEILASPYAAADTDSTLQVANKLMPEINRTGQTFFYDNVLRDSYLLNMEMKQNGLLIDWEQWAYRSTYFENAMSQIYEDVAALPTVAEFERTITTASKGKKKFSLKSTPQMQALLFNCLGVQPTGRVTKKKKPSMDAAALKSMLLQEGLSAEARTFITKILEASKISTYRGTFINQFAEVTSNVDGRIHPDFHNFTESARRGCKAPNAQNIPDASYTWPEGVEKDPFNIRMIIRARPGYKLINLDYAQLEFRLAACYSNDANMIAGCIHPKPNDAHTRVARKLEDIIKIYSRDLAKTVNFGVIYGASWKRLQSEIYEATGVLLSEQQCRKIIIAMKLEYPDLFATITKYQNFAEKNKYVISPIIGHRRLLPHIDSTDEAVADRAKREGWNHLVQSMGHDLLEMALQAFYWTIKDNELPWYLEDDLHDGLLMEVPEEDALDALRMGKYYMENVPRKVLGSWLKVPLIAEPKMGSHFGNLKEVEL